MTHTDSIGHSNFAWTLYCHFKIFKYSHIKIVNQYTNW